MKVFVTGASGGMGSAICRALIAAGHSVEGMTHQQANVDVLRARGIVPLLADIREPNTYSAQAGDADAIIHTAELALPLRVTAGAISKVRAAELIAVETLIEAAQRGRCRSLVYTSGVLVYGPGDAPRAETDATNPYPLCAHKIEGENRVLRAFKESKVPAVILRPGATYGSSGLFVKQFVQPMLSGKRARYAGGGKNRISYIHCDDLAQAYLRAVEHPQPGEIFNVCDNEPVSLRGMLEEIARALGAPPPGPLPAFIVKLVMGMFGPAVLSSNVTSNRKLVEQLGVRLKYPTYREGAAALVAELRAAQPAVRAA